jgi:hypothetical protein
MRAKPVPFFNSNEGARPSNMKTCRLKHFPFILPNEVYFSFREFILAKQSDNPSKQFAFIGIVEVIVIIVSVLVVIYTLLDILYIGNCPYFACGFVEEYLPRILDH